MLKIGSKIDLDFEVYVPVDGKKTVVRLGDLITRRTVVSVYMKNNTSVCDLQTAELAAKAEDFAQRGVDLIALSKDTCGSHLKYAEKQGISYTLVSDPEKRFAQATDSLVEKSMYGKRYLAPLRNTYIINPDGTLLAVLEVDAPHHAEQLLEALDRLA